MFNEQIVELNWRSWAPWPYIYSNNLLILRQTQNLKGKSSSGILFTTKI